MNIFIAYFSSPMSLPFAGSAGIRSDPIPQSKAVAGVPLYAFDTHTRLGKRAIERLISEQAERILHRTRLNAGTAVERTAGRIVIIGDSDLRRQLAGPRAG